MTDEAKTAQETALDAAGEKATETNAARSGKGTRVAVGQTRGRNPQVISWERFDESQPDTLPTTLSEFMSLAKVEDEKLIVSYLIDGYNSAAYSAASDPVSEFVEASWPEDVQRGFKTVVRNFAANNSMTIEDAAGIIKPAYLKSQASAQ